MPKKVRTFAPANKEQGSVAQLNRASDYGSEGCGFESRRNHLFSFAVVQWNVGSVAQLNRASDYGSEGCGFESRRNHKERFFNTSLFLLLKKYYKKL